MKASDLHHDGLKPSHPVSNSQAPAPAQGWMLLNPSGALGKSHPLVQLKEAKLVHLCSYYSEQPFGWDWNISAAPSSTSNYGARKGCACPRNNRITGTLVYDEGLGYTVPCGQWQSRDRQSHLLHLLQVPAITAKAQKKAQAESLPKVASG